MIQPSKPHYFSTFELLLLGMFAALVVAGNVALRLPIKMPGHSGIAWMGLLVVARSVVPKIGAGLTVGALSGMIAGFAGIGDKGALDTVLSYGAAGLGVELIAGVLPFGQNAIPYVLAGVTGNLAKLAVKIVLEIWIGIPTGFVIVGRLYPAFTHVIFGLAGGTLGFLVVRALRAAGYFAYLAEKR